MQKLQCPDRSRFDIMLNQYKVDCVYRCARQYEITLGMVSNLILTAPIIRLYNHHKELVVLSSNVLFCVLGFGLLVWINFWAKQSSRWLFEKLMIDRVASSDWVVGVLFVLILYDLLHGSHIPNIYYGTPLHIPMRSDLQVPGASKLPAKLPPHWSVIVYCTLHYAETIVQTDLYNGHEYSISH